jgi:exosortase/archaeosortase family protein
MHLRERIIIFNWRFKETSQNSWPLWLQVLVFVLAFATLQILWGFAQGTVVERIGVDRATVMPAAWLVNLFTPDVHASAVGGSIRAPGGGINILNGCEGFEVLFLLVAALVVTPLTWRQRAIGLLGGAVLVWVLNQGRIVVLFYANRADKELFALLHGTIAPLVLVVTVAIAFLLYLAVVQDDVAK